MKKFTTFLVTYITLFLFINYYAPTNATETIGTTVNVWPKPRKLTWDGPHKATLLSPNLQFHFPRNIYLYNSVRYYKKLIVRENYKPFQPPKAELMSNNPPLERVEIEIKDLSAPLKHGVNESYTIWISSTYGANATIVAETVWGAIRGLETFSQLVWANPKKSVPVGVYVWDEPLFAHRGIMLDTSRNYYYVEDILRTIRAMGYNKLNVLHWHITDSQSFPLVLPSNPELAAKGSYGSNMQYYPDDVRRIVQYGLLFGVRVVPEIDSPGHTGSWAGAYPDIVTCANMFWWSADRASDDRLAAEPGTGQLNPLNPKTYKVLKNVIHDVASMFSDEFYYGGADEITPGCWKVDPTIQSFLAKNGTLSDILEIFISKTLPYIVSHNKTVVYWEDVLLDSTVNVSESILPKEHVILQTWNNGPNNTKRIVSSGYRAIVSSSEFYYLDCGHGGFVGNNSLYDPPATSTDTSDGGSWCGPFKTWENIYNYDITYGLTEEESKLVIGGEVALWSEQADPTVLDPRLWPRTSAMAETLWSGNRDEAGMKRYAEATDRLNEWRYRMVRRGIRAEPIQPLWCIMHPTMCNLVH